MMIRLSRPLALTKPHLLCVVVFWWWSVQRSVAYLPQRSLCAVVVRRQLPPEKFLKSLHSHDSAKRQALAELGLYPGRRRFHRSWRDDHRQTNNNRRNRTTLAMGLRSGFRSLIGGKGKEWDDDDDKKPKRMVGPPATKKSTSTRTSPGEGKSPKNVDDSNEVESSKTLNKPIRMGELPDTKEVDVKAIDRQESVQERINRVKAGKMTPEEKAAFLESALTAGPTAEARLPLRVSTNKESASASPFPKDSIIRAIASGKKPVSGKDEFVRGADYDEQRKKREFLDMVTGPDRFNPYKTAKTANAYSNKPAAPKTPMKNTNAYSEMEDVPPIDPNTPVSQLVGPATNEPRSPAASFQPQTPAQQSPHQVPVARSSKNIDNTPPAPFEPQYAADNNSDAAPNIAPMPESLGARLGMAAMETENQRKAAALLAKEAQKKLEQEQARQREEYERQAAAIAAEKARVKAEQEAALREAQRLQDEAEAQKRAEAKRIEDDRLAKLMEAQEEYWEKKLAAERASKAEAWGKHLMGEEESVEESEEAPQQGAGFNPNEKYLIEEVRRWKQLFFS